MRYFAMNLYFSNQPRLSTLICDLFMHAKTIFDQQYAIELNFYDSLSEICKFIDSNIAFDESDKKILQLFINAECLTHLKKQWSFVFQELVQKVCNCERDNGVIDESI